MNQEYLFLKVDREYPKYFSFIQRAVRMLGIMFTGRWIRFCHLSNGVIYYPIYICYYFVENLMSLEKFYGLVVSTLIFKFGLNFFGKFISETPTAFFRVVLKS